MKVYRLFAVFLAAALTVAPWGSQAERMQPIPAANGRGAGADDTSLYADGTRAINESRWSDAVGLFNRVAEMHGAHAEGALYWKAYAENKEGQPANALSTSILAASGIGESSARKSPSRMTAARSLNES